MSSESFIPKPLLTVADVATWLSISGSLVYQLVESGKLPVYRVGNGRGAIRFRPEDIESYLETYRIENSQHQTINDLVSNTSIWIEIQTTEANRNVASCPIPAATGMGCL